MALLTIRSRRDIVRWLAPLEHAVRKLLYVEASKLIRPDVAPHWVRRVTAPPRRAPAVRRPVDLARPETWAVQFALAPPRDPLRVPDARAPRIRMLSIESGAVQILRPARTIAPRAPATAPSLRLARRFEALRRVLAEPAPHARRLARYFARVWARYPEAPLRYAAAPPPTNDRLPDDPMLGVACQARAFDVEPASWNSA